MVVQANAEIEATPVPLQVSSSSKDEGLERNSTMEADVEAFGGKREFKFVEFFAGMGGFSRAVGEVEGVKVLAVLDGYAGEWDVLEDQHFQRGVELCNEADHAHFAPMCRTFTMARRDDEFGSVRQLRSMKLPEGWGDPESEMHNKVVVRTVALCLIMENRKRTWSIENPWESYIWLLRCIQKLMKLSHAELVLLHQCAYGAPTMKPTGLLTSSPWMKAVRTLCHEVRPHNHLKMGLVGKVFDFVSQSVVWRTALAAEYPAGLCWAWSKALEDWLRTDEALAFLDQDRLVVAGKWKNVLVKKRAFCETKTSGSKPLSGKDRRDLENEAALGGLRNARKSVQQNRHLRWVGQKVRNIIDELYDKEVMEKFELDVTEGISEDWVTVVRSSLMEQFGVKEETTAEGLQIALWEALLMASKDVDATAIPKWMREGFPLGIDGEIDFTGVFAGTEDDTEAVKASRDHGVFISDEEGLLTNYVSFQEAGQLAQDVVEEMCKQGRVEKFDSWQEVVAKFGQEARLSRMACIVKTRPDGSQKVRLVIDTRRSGVNGLASIRERVILPRVADVAASWMRLKNHNGWLQCDAELMSTDFSEAFNTLNLKPSERKFLIVKGLDQCYYVSRVILFGAAAGPLLWCRLIASSMRLSQAMSQKGESEVSTFVDDPVVVAIGQSSQDRSWIFLRHLALWRALGLKLSWNKAQRGSNLVWIGFELKVESDWFTVRLAEEKKEKLLSLLHELLEAKGMMSVATLQHAAGLLGWVTSAIPCARPWMGMVWAALLQAKETGPKRESTRVRKGLVFVKQVEHALLWISHLVQSLCHKHGSLQKAWSWLPPQHTILIQTDACPTGMGGFLMVANCYTAYWHDGISDEDVRLLGCTRGDPAFQSELELLAIVVSLAIFQEWLCAHPLTAVVLRTDNSASVQAALNFQASSPVMQQLCAELALRVEAMQVQVWPQHIPGVLNVISDALSRFSSESQIPQELVNSQLCRAPIRDESFYLAWLTSAKQERWHW